MTMPQINTDLFEAKLDRATPGESLTNDPDAPYSFEKPPEFTTIHAASEYIFERTQNLTYFIGGPDGHPQVIKKESKSILSLSNLTLPHEMALLVLAEQIFRAISIKKGSKYHR